MADVSGADSAPKKPRTPHLWLWRILWGVVALVVAAMVIVGNNALGKNVTGVVYCGSKSDVTGVFIEADSLPRAWRNGLEIQSGAADWYRIEQGQARFYYWLPLGGAYSIHFGCGSLPGIPGSWATDNRTPYVLGTNQQWWCNDPLNNGSTTLIIKECRSN